MAQDHSGNQSNMFQTVVGHLGLLFSLERRILGLIVSYSIAIGLFSLIVPLTVQELVNTFAFALQPITIVTLAAVSRRRPDGRPPRPVPCGGARCC